jgi:hypothetical protein
MISNYLPYIRPKMWAGEKARNTKQPALNHGIQYCHGKAKAR